MATDGSLSPELRQLLTQGEKGLSQRDKLILAVRQSAAAQIAGAMIIASGRPHSLDEAIRVYTDVLFTLFPQQGQDRYEEWLRERRAKQDFTGRTPGDQDLN
jgi:hypothetical protein